MNCIIKPSIIKPTRRTLLGALGSVIAAPAIVRAGWLPLAKPGAAVPTVIFSNPTINGTNGSPSGWTWRMLVSLGGGSGPLNQVRVTFRSSDDVGTFWQTDHCSIGVYAGSWSQTISVPPVELLFSGTPGFGPVGPSTDIVSDWTTIPSFTSSDKLLSIFDTNAGTGTGVAATGTPTIGTALDIGGQAGASYNLANPTPGSFANFGASTFAVKKIEAQ